MKAKTIAIAAALLTAFRFMVLNVSAEGFLSHEEFEWDDKYYVLVDELQADPEIKVNKIHINKKAFESSDYIKEYYLYSTDGSDLVTICDYKQGNINDFIRNNAFAYSEVFHYTENGMTAKFIYSENADGTLGYTQLYNCLPEYDYSTIGINFIENQAKNFCTEGYVIVIRTNKAQSEWAIISYDGIPKYVVMFDTYSLFDVEDINDDDSYNEKLIKSAYNRLHENGQLVFDFDFMYDLCKAKHGKLDVDYVYHPYGLESELKNKVKKIDGKYIYFDKMGVCKGVYTGTFKKSNGDMVYCKDGVVSE